MFPYKNFKNLTNGFGGKMESIGNYNSKKEETRQGSVLSEITAS